MFSIFYCVILMGWAVCIKLQGCSSGHALRTPFFGLRPAGYTMYNVKPKCRLPENMCIPRNMAPPLKGDREEASRPLPIALETQSAASDTGQSADDGDETESDEAVVKPTIEDSRCCCSSTSETSLKTFRAMQKDAQAPFSTGKDAPSVVLLNNGNCLRGSWLRRIQTLIL